MNLTQKILAPSALVFLLLAISGCSDQTATTPAVETPAATKKQSQAVVENSNENSASAVQLAMLDVHKSPTCGCCEKWIDHLNDHGFQSTVHNNENMGLIKAEKGIEPRYRSCHTAISSQGYVFEGHVPAKFIQQFLSQSHSEDVLGLSVPAMPMGSPGMEVDDRFQPYHVLLLKADGSYEIYATMNTYSDQF